MVLSYLHCEKFTTLERISISPICMPSRLLLVVNIWYSRVLSYEVRLQMLNAN